MPGPATGAGIEALLQGLSRRFARSGAGEGPDIYETLLGVGGDELANRGRALYPETPIGSAHHRLAAKLATQKLGGGLVGAAATQLGGLGVEGLEAVGGGMRNPQWRADTLNDLLANLQGSWDALRSPR